MEWTKWMKNIFWSMGCAWNLACVWEKEFILNDKLNYLIFKKLKQLKLQNYGNR